MTKKVEDADPEIETKKTEERDIVGSDGDVKTCPEAGTEKKSLSDDVEVIKSSKEDTDDDLPVPDKYLVKNWVTLASGLRIRIDEERSSGSEPVVTGIYFEGGPETGIESIWDSWKPESADGQSFVVLSPNIDSHRVYLENPWFRQRGGAGANRISKRGSDSHQPVNVTFSIPGGQPRNQQKKPGFPGPDYISTILSGMRPVSPGMRKQQPYAPMRPQASQYQMPTLQRPTSAPRINVGGPMYNLLPRMPMVNQNAMNCCAQYNAFQQPYGQSPLMCYGPPLYPPLRTTGGGMQLPNRNHFSSQSYRNISDEEIAAVAAAAMSGDGGKHPQVIEIIRDPNDEGSPDDCVVIELENEEECNSFNRKKRNSPVIHVRGGSRQNKSQQSAEKKAPIIIVTGNNPQYPGVTASGGGLKSPLVIVPDKQKGNIMTSTGDNRVLYETRHCGQRVYGGEDMSAGEHEACDSSTDDNYVEPVAYARPCSAAPPRNQQGGACSPGQYLSPSAPGQNPYYTERRPRTSAEPQRRAVVQISDDQRDEYLTQIINNAQVCQQPTKRRFQNTNIGSVQVKNTARPVLEPFDVNKASSYPQSSFKSPTTRVRNRTLNTVKMDMNLRGSPAAVSQPSSASCSKNLPGDIAYSGAEYTNPGYVDTDASYGIAYGTNSGMCQDRDQTSVRSSTSASNLPTTQHYVPNPIYHPAKAPQYACQGQNQQQQPQYRAVVQNANAQPQCTYPVQNPRNETRNEYAAQNNHQLTDYWSQQNPVNNTQNAFEVQDRMNTPQCNYQAQNRPGETRNAYPAQSEDWSQFTYGIQSPVNQTRNTCPKQSPAPCTQVTYQTQTPQNVPQTACQVQKLPNQIQLTLQPQGTPNGPKTQINISQNTVKAPLIQSLIQKALHCMDPKMLGPFDLDMNMDVDEATEKLFLGGGIDSLMDDVNEDKQLNFSFQLSPGQNSENSTLSGLIDFLTQSLAASKDGGEDEAILIDILSQLLNSKGKVHVSAKVKKSESTTDTKSSKSTCAPSDATEMPDSSKDGDTSCDTSNDEKIKTEEILEFLNSPHSDTLWEVDPDLMSDVMEHALMSQTSGSSSCISNS